VLLTSMQRHMKTHTRDSPFCCKKCGCGFEKAYLLNRHINSKHRPGGDTKPIDLSQAKANQAALFSRRDSYESSSTFDWPPTMVPRSSGAATSTAWIKTDNRNDFTNILQTLQAKSSNMSGNMNMNNMNMNNMNMNNMNMNNMNMNNMNMNSFYNPFVNMMLPQENILAGITMEMLGNDDE
jgi:hypothetical protein